MTFDELFLCKTVAWMDWRSRHPKGAGAPRIAEIEKPLERRAANEPYGHIGSWMSDRRYERATESTIFEGPEISAVP